MAETLDLTKRERPVLRLDAGDFEMKHPDELYFGDYARVVAIGEQIQELAQAGIGENASELDKLIAEGASEILVDVPPEVVATITPGKFKRLFAFFMRLASKEDEAEASANVSSLSPGASDSTEASVAA